MTRLACSDVQRLPMIKTPRIHAARKRQTTTKVSIAHQPFVDRIKQKYSSSRILCPSRHHTHSHPSFHDRKREEASDHDRIKKHASGKKGVDIVKTLLFPHHCAEAVTKHKALSFEVRERPEARSVEKVAFKSLVSVL